MSLYYMWEFQIVIVNSNLYNIWCKISYFSLIFVPDGGVVGGSRAGPVVTPHTLELTPRGRVLLQLAPPETARAYLPPEYRPGRIYSDTDSEKVRYILNAKLNDASLITNFSIMNCVPINVRHLVNFRARYFDTLHLLCQINNVNVYYSY